MNHHAEYLRKHLEIEEEANRENDPIVSKPLSPADLVEVLSADRKKLIEERDYYRSRYLSARSLCRQWRELALERGDELMGLK